MISRISHVVLAAALAFGASACGQSDGQSSPSQSFVEAPAQTGFDKTLSEAKARLDAQMALPFNVPVPKDAGGGYTHETHKNNAKLIYDAGQLYALTGQEKYAQYAIDLMVAYADVYPGWGFHPEQKEQSPGRMFWQNLNESWWLVHVSQGYGAIKSVASDAQREKIETDLLRNISEFLSDGSPETFNKIHNHGTWATAAVGLTGYAIGDQDYVDQALLGLDKSGNYGFLKQLDRLFSPDGYYNEGPYYQRYALMPFVVFASAVEQNNPERKIFEYRDGILEKAIDTTIQQSYGGLFFPINDALKDKGIATTELLYGVSIAYDLSGDPGLLSIAQEQGKYVLTPESRKVAEDIARGKAKPYDFKTMRLGDGASGGEGALDILRASADPKASVVVMKNTSQGLGHGHFDKLGYIFYDNGTEIIQDYGAARFLNIEAKYGGHYLPENNSFAKQTIAHNALVVDETSHFKGNTKTGNNFHPTAGVFADEADLQISSAQIDTAYEGVNLIRMMAIIHDDALPKPIVIDLMRADASGVRQYDLPVYFSGQLIETNFKLAADPVSRKPLGYENGYQHLWDVARAKPVEGLSQVTWLNDRRFYTVSSAVPNNSEIIFVEVGANDPNFNLRRQQAFILRAAQDGGVSYASVIEPHGEYNPTVEFTLNSHSQVKSLEAFNDGQQDYVRVELKSGQIIGLATSQNMDAQKTHTINVDGQSVTWTGPYTLFHSDAHKTGKK